MFRNSFEKFIAAVKAKNTSEEQSALHNYKIEWPLGCGAFSTVFKAEHNQTGEPLAIKITALEGHNAAVPVGIQREITLLSSLQHDNIVSLNEHFIENGRYCFITRYNSPLSVRCSDGATAHNHHIDSGVMSR